MKLIAIDPGPEESAYLVYNVDTGLPLFWNTLANHRVLIVLDEVVERGVDHFAVEMIASYGMPVGADVFETCVWIGKFEERWKGAEPIRVTRVEARSHVCHSAKAGDPNVRQALIDRYGPGKAKAIGLKASPGPLYKLTGHCWQALAVAVTAADTRLLERAA